MSPRLFWIIRHAVKDTRGVRGQLVVFMLSMVLGVAALVSINAIGENLTDAADSQAKVLLGADLRLRSNSKFDAVEEALIDSIGGDQARLYSFASMALAQSTGRTRLVSIRATDRGYPFYGEIITDPASAAESYLDGNRTIVDGTVLTQLGLAVGDSLRIGRIGYRIEGRIVQSSRETSAMSSLSPRIYLPRASVDSLLLAYGSRVDYEVYFRFTDGRDADALVSDLRETLRALEIRSSTVEREKREWNESLTNLYRFLSIVAFVALLLGGLGVASSMHVYIKRRLSSVAVLRCLGATPAETTLVYVTQAVLLGLIGSALGTALGIAIQQALPGLVNSFSPLDVTATVSAAPILLGLTVGTVVSALFAVLPILSVSDVAPLRVLQQDTSNDEPARSRTRSLLLVMATLGLAAVAVLQAPAPLVGIAYLLGLIVVFTALRLTAASLTRLARKARIRTLPFAFRQGISSLFRPGNQTALLTITIGFIAFLIFLLLGLRSTLLNQVSLSAEGGRPNLIFFDIQPDQADGVKQLVQSASLPVLEVVPIVSMRIASINGRSIGELRRDDAVRVGWAHTREYRSSYRDTLNLSETLTDGVMVPSVADDFDVVSDVVPVTIAADLADELAIGIGDSLDFDVQGLSVRTEIVGIREVDWAQLSTNFYFVFPTGVIEDAPSTFVVVTRGAGEAAVANIQADVVNSYPNVSAIDLTLVLSVIETVFGRIAAVIQFLALFCIGTGILVLVGSITSGQKARSEESVLLKTLGASHKMIQRILATEYAFVGLIATLSGMVLGLFAVWLFARFSFGIPTHVLVGEYLIVAVSIVAITVAVGMMLSRAVYKESPLRVLRNEV